MPMHDWTKVDAGIYHVLHHEWISEIHRAVLRRLPEGYYSMPEQRTGSFESDVLTLSRQPKPEPDGDGNIATLARPRTKIVEESTDGFYLRKQKVVAIRHVSGHRLVAVIEIVSPGNKDSGLKYRTFVRKARDLLERRIHLLVVDPFAPPAHHPKGLHHDIAKGSFRKPFRSTPEQPLGLIAYECDDTVRAYVEPFAVGDRLRDMPIYLEPEKYIPVPLEDTYSAAWTAIPPYWQAVVAG